MRVFRTCFEEKIHDYLLDNAGEEKKSACIVFNHGLGDYILFLPIFKRLQEIFKKSWDLKIGSTPDKGYKCLCKDAIFITAPYGKYANDFDVFFNINYIEPPRDNLEFFNDTLLQDCGKNVEDIKNLSKPELCNLLEIGIPDFEWKYERIKTKDLNNKSKRVGIHFFGYAWSQDKNTSFEVSKRIWEEVSKSGYEPFEIQMIPPNKLGVIEFPFFITRENSLRFTYPNLRIMIQEISKCKYFIGVDSGPLYLAISILGPDSCIGLEKNREIKKVFPRPSINLVNVKDYKNDTIFNIFNEEEN